MSASIAPSLLEQTPLDREGLRQALAALRQKGNPFRQQFARNSDDAVCSLYHVDDLFIRERTLLVDLVESYRARPDQQTAVLPLLGARGAGKTHLLHWLKHGPGLGARLFVTPGTFRIDKGGSDSSFLEYLLYQCINVLLAGGEQGGVRPLVAIGEHLTRGLLRQAIAEWSQQERMELFASSAFSRFRFKLGLAVAPATTALEELYCDLKSEHQSIRTLALGRNLDLERLTVSLGHFVEGRQPRDLKGELRKRIMRGLLRSTLLRDDSELADFLTDGFTDVGFAVPPSREQLTLSLLMALTEVIVGAGIPIAVAFDQLEELLYGQTADEVRRSSDAFFGGIVQIMSQVPGLCILLFVEEGLWNRIVPPLPPHILDRIHEPLYLPAHGLVRGVRLSKPNQEQLASVVACRVRRTLAGYADAAKLPLSFPFGAGFLSELAQRETVLRLMLQGCCSRLDEIFESSEEEWLGALLRSSVPVAATPTLRPVMEPVGDETLAEGFAGGSADSLEDRWFHEVRSAERKLKPVGSLAGANAEIHGALARWLHLCRSLGVEQDHWQMSAIEDQVQIGSHPNYGSLLVIEWQKGAEKVRVGVGLWLGRGVGKPRDLETKLGVFAMSPTIIDHLILLRPADDVRLSGKTQASWEAAIAAGHRMTLQGVDLATFARLYAFPRWMQGVQETHATGQIPASVYEFLAKETGPILELLSLPESEPKANAA
jgi:hypothetical protein